MTRNIFKLITILALGLWSLAASGATQVTILTKATIAPWTPSSWTLVILTDLTDAAQWTSEVYVGVPESGKWTNHEVKQTTIGFSNTLLYLAGDAGMINLPAATVFGSQPTWSPKKGDDLVLRVPFEELKAQGIAANEDTLKAVAAWGVPVSK